MSNETKQKLQFWLPITLALLSAFYAVLLLPYRMQAAEANISKLQYDRQIDHDTLTRIDENVKALLKSK